MCQDIGSFEARAKGVGDRQQRDLHRYRDSEHFDELERLVLDLAVGMTVTPVQVSDELIERPRPPLRLTSARRAGQPDRRREPPLALQRRLCARRRRLQRGHGLRPHGAGPRGGGWRRASSEGLRGWRRRRHRPSAHTDAGAGRPRGDRHHPLGAKAEALRSQGAQAVVLDALDESAVQTAVAGPPQTP